MPQPTTLSRRAFLRPRTASLNEAGAAGCQSTAAPVSLSELAPYSGPWTKQEAGHLLSRATFGATFTTLNQATSIGLEATLDLLLADLPAPPPPVAIEDDTITPQGESFADYAYPRSELDKRKAVIIRRNITLSWLNELRVGEGISARETMVLFWHNHFANNNFNDPRWNFRHIALLRRQSFGNFRELVKEMTVDAVMLAFLNGNRNTARAPNENYARELLELFTIGKGPQVGPGDYTNYTEEDVVAMARSLTGWTTNGYRSSDPDVDITPQFNPGRHDAGTVQLSPRFDNRELTSSGRTTYARLVDLILEKDAVAEFVVRKLYRWFVYYDITPEAEANFIRPLAAMFREGNYELRPVLRALFGSEHFFDVRSQGPVIKHPIRLIVGTMRQLEVEPANDNRVDEDFYYALYARANQVGMGDFRPPSVAGWKAFYQEPLYYRDWINSATLPLRKDISDRLFANRSNLRGYGTVKVSLLSQVQTFDRPGELWPMIDEWVSLLFPRPIPDSQRNFLKNLLLPGLPDTQWAVEYAELRANPNDGNLARALETNLRRMVKAMLEMPEFQLC